MNEYVWAAIVRGNEAKALVLGEEFYVPVASLSSWLLSIPTQYRSMPGRQEVSRRANPSMTLR